MSINPKSEAVLDLELHEKQLIAFKSTATEQLFGGAAGGGKSHLMRAAAIHWCGAIPNLQVYLFRRLSNDLEKNHMEGEGGFPDMLSIWIEAKLCKITYHPTKIRFWNGSTIYLSHCQHEKDKLNYQGVQIGLLLIDELTHFSESIYRYLRGRCRLGKTKVPKEYKGLFPRIICGSNPSGIGHNWVKRAFIDSAPPFDITKQSREEGGKLRQFIPSKLEDNPTMLENDPDYEDTLSGLGAAHLVKAMRDGDWNIVAGGAFDDVWNTERLVVPRFIIPKSWRIDRAFDWGSAHPFSVGWFAEADGTEAFIVSQGQKRAFCPPRGSIIQISEWYGCVAGKSNQGLKMSSTDVAIGIIEREKLLKRGGLISTRVNSGPADNQIDNVIDSQTPTLAAEMAKKGVLWTKSDKSSGSRQIGFELLRQYVRESAKDTPELPSIYFMESCRASISQLPVLPRDEKKIEDVDTNSEDHVYDMIRYRVLATKGRLAKLPTRGT
tara:strand:+ start:4654 stop:6132 length:1479 start_codon:yes stop_codon:yes gene_type:complete